MAASHKTIEEIVKVLLKHVDKDAIKEIIKDLNVVDGNQSFKETIRRIEYQICMR